MRAFADADLYVLPTHSENFGMTVAESLAAGTPVIVTKGAPWSEVNKRGVGWCIDIGAQPLVNCLREALSLPRSDLQEMGARGSEWMELEFAWRPIAESMSGVYQWLLGQGDRPDCVYVD